MYINIGFNLTIHFDFLKKTNSPFKYMKNYKHVH